MDHLENKKLVIASACLVGFPCRWDGQAKPNAKIIKMFREGKLLPICPEILAGLDTPRPACEIQKTKKGQRIINNRGRDFTKQYRDGAKIGLKIAKKFGVKKAHLKCGSPSCGAGTIYDGTFTSKKIKGYGIFASLLIDNGIEVVEID